MREILFKARRKNWKELPKKQWWVEGYYVCIDNVHYIYTGSFCDGGLYDISERFEIDINTLCQYTGLTDKNGQKIWENDVVNCFEAECCGKISRNESESGFFFNALLEDDTYEEEHIYDYVDCMKVIGNIFDNPELFAEQRKTEESRLNPLCPEKQYNQTIIKQFICAKEMLDYILEGHDLYNPIIERYVFAYNDRNAICVYTGIDSVVAENLQKNVEAGEAEHWSELLSQTGGIIFEEANPFKNSPFKNIDWCESYYKETGWVDTSDCLKMFESEEEFELE